jgi:CBS domain-containing protein
VLPLMACVGLSIWLVDRLQMATSGEPVGGMERIGLNIQSSERTLMLERLLVREVMQQKWVSFPSHLTLLEATAKLVAVELRSAIVVDDRGVAVGILTLDDLNRALAEPKTLPSITPIEIICTNPILYAYGDETVATAIGRMGGRDLHQLPVVEREQPTEIIGLLCRETIGNACSLAIARGHLADQLAILPSLVQKE